MKNVDKELSILGEHEVVTDWRAKAQWRRENRRWLRYSGYIALKVMRRLEELKMSQKELAIKMNCSPQYVSKLLKGYENLTLETISRLEDNLNIDLIQSSLTYVGGYGRIKQSYGYLSEPSSPEDTVTSGTSAFVDGYDAPGSGKRREGPR